MWQGKAVSEWTEEEKWEFLMLLAEDSCFAPIHSFMEKKLPKVWEDYLKYIAMKTNSDINRPFTHCFNKQLSLSNLIQYLLDNQEWVWVECPKTCALYAPRKECILEDGKTICMNTGKVKHPAFEYAESLKEGK